VRYFRDYGILEDEVDDKLRADIVRIGRPDVGPNQRCWIDFSEGRYHIQDV
jgi:hypothetical protein